MNAGATPASRKLPPAIFLLGPTASGKTAVSLQLAQRFPVEIVSVDSALVYRGMNVGTAKPTAEERAQVAHHLIDMIDPTERFSAAQFRNAAVALAAEITARQHIPLFVGGTMLYFRALAEGLSTMPGADQAVRTAIDARAAEHGWPHLHRELAIVDPETATRLAPSDAQRIQRALEVFETTGRSLSDWHQASGAQSFPYRVLRLGLSPSDRSMLHRRIEIRFDAMLARGLVAELVTLRSRYPLEASMPSMRCVGYRQAWQHLEGEFGADELARRGLFATRQLAKRQLTWMRAMHELQTIDCLAQHPENNVVAAVAAFLGPLQSL